jgi:hypothetical protein
MIHDDNRIAFISGCQRSGTTLLRLILDTHSQISGFDENEFVFEQILTPNYKKGYSIYKAPNYSHVFHEKKWRSFPLIWIKRSPVDVVSSMINLRMGNIHRKQNLVKFPTHYLSHIYKNKTINYKLPWIVKHGTKEIENNSSVLLENTFSNAKVNYLIDKFEKTKKENHWKYSKKDLVILGAICWKIKDLLFNFLSLTRDDLFIITYENLIVSPQKHLTLLLEFLDLPFEHSLLEHHKNQKGIKIGYTDAEIPITNYIGKGYSFFNSEEIEEIEKICNV